MSIHFLWRYPTEHERTGLLKSATTQRVRGAGFYAQKVQALKEQILVNEAEATL